jgi:hypothetical protein
MTTVSEITPVVNLDTGYDCRQSGRVTPVEALLLRIDEVLEGKRFKSEREWCRKAGVAQTYIAALRLRGGKGGTGEVRDVKREQVVRLARAAGLDVSYLMGEDLAPKTLAAPPVVRNAVEDAIAEFDWPPDMTAAQAKEVLTRVRAEAQEHSDLPRRFWTSRLAKLASDVHEARSRVRRATGGTSVRRERTERSSLRRWCPRPCALARLPRSESRRP